MAKNKPKTWVKSHIGKTKNGITKVKSHFRGKPSRVKEGGSKKETSGKMNSDDGKLHGNSSIGDD